MRAGVAPRPLVRGPALTRAALVLGGGGGLLFATLVMGIALGSVPIAPDDVLRVLGHRLLGIGSTSGVSDSLEAIVVDLRLPRVLGAMVVGAGLACAGTVFQAILRNPMADPYIIGTAAGASLGATVGIVVPLLRAWRSPSEPAARGLALESFSCSPSPAASAPCCSSSRSPATAAGCPRSRCSSPAMRSPRCWRPAWPC